MATTISTQDIVDAKRDIEDIGEAVNEVKIVSPRYGAPFKSIPMTVAELQAAIETAAAAAAGANGWTDLLILTQDGSTQRAKNDSFQAQINSKSSTAYVDAQDSALQNQINKKASAEYLDNALEEQTNTVNTALSNLSTVASKFYPTLAEANADIANITVDQPVTIGEVVNGGLWYKATLDSTTLTKSGYDPLMQAKEFSRKYGYIFSGLLTKCEFNPDGSYTISHTELRFEFGGGKSFVLVKPQTDLVIPASRLYYVDLTGAVAGSTLTGQVTPTDYNSQTYGLGAFVEDLKIPLFAHRSGKKGQQIGGKLVQNGLPVLDYVNTQDDAIRTIAQRQGYSLEGRLTKCLYSSSNDSYTISHPKLRIFLGGGRSYIIVDAVTDLTIPASRLYYVDINGATVGSTLNGIVTDSDYYSSSFGTGAFVDDLKLPLFGHRASVAGNQISGKLVQNGLPVTIPTTSSDSSVIIKKTATTMDFFIKGTRSNYLKYGFNRTQVPFDGGATANSQSDHWRLIGCYEVDATFTDVRGGVPIVATGEWECAIRESGGKADAVGGYHGDELQTNSFFIVDGKRYAQDAVFDLNAKELQFVQESVIYSCNTQTPICKHLKRYRITKDGIDLYQEFEWIVATGIANAWLTMLPIKRLLNDTSGAQITDHATRYPSYALEDISTAGFSRVYTPVKDGDSVCIWGNTSGISAEVIFKKVATPTAEMYIDSPTAYNKIYLLGTGQGVYTTTVGEKWIQHSIFKLNTSN